MLCVACYMRARVCVCVWGRGEYVVSRRVLNHCFQRARTVGWGNTGGPTERQQKCSAEELNKRGICTYEHRIPLVTTGDEGDNRLTLDGIMRGLAHTNPINPCKSHLVTHLSMLSTLSTPTSLILRLLCTCTQPLSTPTISQLVTYLYRYSTYQPLHQSSCDSPKQDVNPATRH